MDKITLDVQPNELILVVPNHKMVIAVSDVATAEQAYYTLLHLAEQIHSLIDAAVLSHTEMDLES